MGWYAGIAAFLLAAGSGAFLYYRWAAERARLEGIRAEALRLAAVARDWFERGKLTEAEEKAREAIRQGRVDPAALKDGRLAEPFAGYFWLGRCRLRRFLDSAAIPAPFERHGMVFRSETGPPWPAEDEGLDALARVESTDASGADEWQADCARGILSYSRGRLEEAAERLGAAARHPRRDRDVPVLLARVLREMGRGEEAEKLLRNFVSVHSDYVEARILAARILQENAMVLLAQGKDPGDRLPRSEQFLQKLGSPRACAARAEALAAEAIPLIRAGEGNEAMRRLEEAVREARAAGKGRPESAVALARTQLPLALLALDRGEAAPAEQALSESLEELLSLCGSHRESGDLLLELGRVAGALAGYYRNRGRRQEAERVRSRALEVLGSASPGGEGAIARAWLQLDGSPAEAVRILESLPSGPRRSLEAAAMHLELGERKLRDREDAEPEFLRALRELEPILSGSAESVAPWILTARAKFGLAEAARRAGRDPRPALDAARADLDRAEKLDGRRWEIPWLRGKVIVALAQAGADPQPLLDLAKQQFHQAGKLNPEAAEVYLARARLGLVEARLLPERAAQAQEDALRELGRAVVQNRLFLEAWVARAELRLALARRSRKDRAALVEQAIEDLRQAGEVNPAAGAPLVLLAEAHLDVALRKAALRQDPWASFRDAQEAARRAVEADPSAAAYAARALAKAQEIRVRRARGEHLPLTEPQSDAERAVALDPDLPLSLLARAAVLVEKGDTHSLRQAETDLNRLLEGSPEHAEARLLRAEVRLALGWEQPEALRGAEADFVEALAHEPEEPRARRGAAYARARQALVLAAAGKNPDLSSLQRQAAALDPPDRRLVGAILALAEGERKLAAGTAGDAEIQTAVRLLEEAGRDDPKSTDIFLWQARAAIADGRSREAGKGDSVPAFERGERAAASALELLPDLVEALRLRCEARTWQVRAMLRRGAIPRSEAEQALEAGDAAVRADPASLSCRAARAAARFAYDEVTFRRTKTVRGLYGGALEDCEWVLGKAEDHAEALALRGRIRFRRGEWTAAARDLEAALAARPSLRRELLPLIDECRKKT